MDGDSGTLTLSVVTGPLRAGLDTAWGMFSALGSKIKDLTTTAFGVFFEQMPLFMADFGTGLRAGFSSLREVEAGIARVENVIRSTGGVAGKSADDIYEMAQALQDTTTFSADAAVAAQGVLLQFKNVRGDVFDRVVKSAADFAATTGDDLSSAMDKLGRAIDDPIVGLGRLRTEGIRFSASEKQMIQQMIYSGKVMEAQNFILDRVAGTFGGAAQEKAKTFSGQIERINNLLDDMWTTIAKSLVPIFEVFLPYIEAMTKSTTASAESWVQWSEVIATAIKNLLPTIENWYNQFMDGATVAAKWVVERLVEAFTFIQTIIDDFPNAWEAAVDKIKYWWESLAIAMRVTWEKITVSIENLWTGLVGRIKDKWSDFTDWTAQVIARIPGVASALGVSEEDLVRSLSETQELMKSMRNGPRPNAEAIGMTTEEESRLRALDEKQQQSGGRFGDRYQQNLAANRIAAQRLMDTITSGFAATRADATTTAARNALKAASQDTAFTFEKEQSDSGSAGTFEDLASLQRRIQSAAFKSPEASLMERQIRQQGSQHAESEASRRRLERIAERQERYMQRVAERLERSNPGDGTARAA